MWSAAAEEDAYSSPEAQEGTWSMGQWDSKGLGFSWLLQKTMQEYFYIPE